MNLLRPRPYSRTRLGPDRFADLLGARDAAAAAPQHRHPGADVFARGGFGVVVAEGGEAELYKFVVPRGDTEKTILRLGAVAGEMKRRALEARALGRILDGEISPQIDLSVEPAWLRQKRLRSRPLELGLDDRRLGVVGDRGALEVVDEDVKLPARLRIVQTEAIARFDFLEVGRVVEREAFDFFRRFEPEHIDRRNPERRHRRDGTKNQREQGGWDCSHQVFIDSKNSALLLVLRNLSNRKSIASMVPIGLRMRRKTYIFFSTAGSVSNSSLRVPERVMSIAGKVRLSATFLSKISSELPVPLNSSKMTSSIRLPVSISAVAMMVSEPPSSILRAAPKKRLGRCRALESTPPERALPEGGTMVL